MNLPTKLTVARIVLSIIIIILLCFPWYDVGITVSSVTLTAFNTPVQVSYLYIISGVLFLIASVTDYFDGKIARKRGLITNTGKMLDAIADKVLVNSVLIILAADGKINAAIPVIVVLRDILVNAIKMEAASKGTVVAAIKSGKLKTACLMIGIVLKLFGNIPFEFKGLYVADGFLIFATLMSLISMYQYYNLNKKIIFEDKKK